MIKPRRFKRYPTTAYQREAMQVLRPPENLTVSEWAEKYRVLDTKTAAIPGPWRNDKTPYLVGIMDELNNYETEEVIFCKPTQVGGTEAILNALGYIIQQDPSPAMVVYPSDLLTDSIKKNRIDPLIYGTPTVKARYHEPESSLSELQFDGMYIALVGSNSPSQLASRPIRYLFLDEVDKYPGASKKEADPISLAKERTKTFRTRKIFETSTPTLKTGPIWRDLEAADEERHYFVPCPHCGQYIELKWSQVKFPDEPGMTYADRAEFAVYKCQKCGGIITDRHKPDMLRLGQWRTVRSTTKYKRKIGFWMNTLYSPFVRFSEVAKTFLATKDDPELFQNFVNSWLAEPWEDTKLKTNADTVLERQTALPEFVVPKWAKLLTAGIDVQETSVYYTIRAWGDYMTSQNITHGQVMDFAEIERIMNLQYEREDGGAPMTVTLALVDSGDNTDAVYEFCARNSEWAAPSKGASKKLDFLHWKVSHITRKETGESMALMLIDTAAYKDMIASRMRRANGRYSWMVYKGCDREYAEQVTSEHKINVKKNGRVVQKWDVKHSHADNHYLDCEVYAMCAADYKGARTWHLQTEPEPITKPAPERQPAAAPEENWIGNHDGWLTPGG